MKSTTEKLLKEFEKELPDNTDHELLNMLKPTKGERFEISHFEISQKDAQWVKMTSTIKGDREYFDILPGKYVKLIDHDLKRLLCLTLPWRSGRIYIL